MKDCTEDNFLQSFDAGEQSPDLFDPEVFAAGKTCSGFPGPGLKDHTYTFNPMAEFVHGRSSHVDEAFNEFIETHKKEYSHDAERDAKKDIFRQNMRYINSINRQNLSYKVLHF